jgi:EmrB/QacA subfamily drug resistance transporter
MARARRLDVRARNHADTPATGDPTTEDSTRRGLLTPKVAVAITYVASLFMSAMDNHIVNVMIPTLSRQFHSPLASVQWTTLGYVLSLAVFIPASGWFGDRYGTKRIFLVALATFTLASAACGQAHSLVELISARIVQGAGGGMLTPVATAMLYRAYPPSERARMTRILVVPVLLGPILAQPIGGLLVTKASWRWAFYLNVPIGIAAFVISLIYLVEHRDASRGRFDVPGFVLSGGGLSALLYAISEGALRGWGSADVIVTGLIGIVALAVFVRVELRQTHPLLNVGLMSDRIFRATNIVNSFNTIAFGGLLFLAPLFLQEAEGQTALDSGLTTFFTAVGVMCSSQTIGRIYPRVGPRRMTAISQFSFAAMLCSFLFVGEGINLWIVRGLLFLCGACNSGTQIAVQTSMFSTISSADTGSGAAIFNAARQSATAIGVSIFTVVISSVHSSRLAAFHVTFLVAAGFCLLAAVSALGLIHDSDAAATMRPAARAAAKEATSPTTSSGELAPALD